MNIGAPIAVLAGLAAALSSFVALYSISTRPCRISAPGKGQRPLTRLLQNTSAVALAAFVAVAFFVLRGTADAIPELRPELESQIDVSALGSPYFIDEMATINHVINRSNVVAYLDDHAKTEKLEIAAISANGEVTIYRADEQDKFFEEANSLARVIPIKTFLVMGAGIPCGPANDGCLQVEFYEDGRVSRQGDGRPSKIEAMFTENGKVIGVADHLERYTREVLTSSFGDQDGDLCAWLAMTRDDSSFLDLRTKALSEGEIRVTGGTLPKDEIRVAGDTIMGTGDE